MAQADEKGTRQVGPGDTGIEEVRRCGVNWLLKQHNGDGGWGQRHGDKSNSLNTAEAMIALLDSDANVSPGDHAIRQGRDFLLQHQSNTPPDAGAWTRSVGADPYVRDVPDVMRTSLAIEALLRSGVAPTDEPIVRATAWLESVRRDGGLGYDSTGSPAFLPTCIALMAMITACRSLEASEQPPFFAARVVPLRDYIMGRRNADGSFDASGPLQGGHTIYGILAVQKIRICGFDVHPTAESDGLEWLRRHPNEAMALVEEEIILDPSDPDTNYSFLYMTDALLVRVMHAAADQAEVGSELSRRALYEVWKRWTDDGGFLGNRVFTWSTSKCLLALKAAEHEPRFPSLSPELEPETIPTIPNRSVFWAVLVAIFAGGVVVIALGKFDPLAMTFMIVVLLVALFAVGRLTERGFLSAMRSALGSAGSPPK
jgi:hypothetical protein